jgi:hypothetical protein
MSKIKERVTKKVNPGVNAADHASAADLQTILDLYHKIQSDVQDFTAQCAVLKKDLAAAIDAAKIKKIQKYIKNLKK